MHIDLQDKSIDYLTAMSDVRKSIAFRRERGWSWDMIAQMLEGLGQLADMEIDEMLISMASKEDKVLINQPMCTCPHLHGHLCECETADKLQRQKDLTHPSE